jgi:enediyne biosynthesis protein E4
VLGLGSATKVDWLDIHWPAPSTVVQKLINIPCDRYLTLTEGQGAVITAQ